MNTTSYVALLRGINVGGNSLIKMPELTKAFKRIGCQNVSSVLASGNIVFEITTLDTIVLKKRIERMLVERFSLTVTAILRTRHQILNLIELNPFGGTKPAAQTKHHVTFLDSPANGDARFPVQLPSELFHIVQISSLELCSTVDLASCAKTPDLMKFLEKQFGRNITTRTWNTVEKIASSLMA